MREKIQHVMGLLAIVLFSFIVVYPILSYPVRWFSPRLADFLMIAHPLVSVAAFLTGAAWGLLPYRPAAVR